MEIKIGVKQSPREIVMESDENAKDLAARIEESVKAESLLSFTDSKGRQVFVPSAALAYVEIGTEAARRVGFGA
ncbi:MAG: DUF3107 domain-containing protein [Brevibacterium sp.]|uniref:DUF3107 domain-containing protein n=1 Tax=Brevibacterium sp. TaxID=1701 RepID=UPI00264A4B20|nr:DUF3107 domain-containing protein [Brevibacterium sp.]MDN5833812.1 DUF3107 domain-containing protein [Brevibacterium sp.]MDN5876693.1 DUF3107 domain-containing protein [Brevibacterium sp.]MDN5909401.1 DUF3107 domain-containing protein [Brevibacterium sp.]MDN6133545.1 DUF3107 domain-containing protein [Brevibacterium sp.]MDN6158909.1 DUF3107 domain-containing protein [Brevibacterium sp.]